MSRRHTIILAVAPSSRGFGFIVLTNTGTLLDWGVKETRRHKNRQAAAMIGRMLATIQPAAMIVERCVGGHCRRSARVRTLLDEIVGVAEKGGAPVFAYSRSRIGRTFGERGRSRDSIAGAVAEELPPLRPWLPAKRRIWESEHHSMAIFEAAALALTHLKTSGNGALTEARGAAHEHAF